VHLGTHRPSSSLPCPDCCQIFAHQDSFRRHVPEKHNECLTVSNSLSTRDFLCCFCTESFCKRAELLIHLNIEHDKNVQQDFFTFSSKNDFQQFLDSLPDSNFVNRKGSVKNAGSDTGLYFVCSRSKESARTKLSHRRVCVLIDCLLDMEKNFC
jgi:hypothetical protein